MFVLGGIFDEANEDLELILQIVLNNLNANSNSSIYINAETTQAINRDALKISKEVCKLLEEGIVAIFGPSLYGISNHIQSMCDYKEMPHIETHWDNKLVRGNCHLNLFPYPAILNEVYVDLVNNLGWTQFTIIYENNDSLFRMSNLIQFYSREDFKVTLRQIDISNSWNYRPMMYLIKNAEETNFVLDCSIEVLEEFLKQAQQVGLMSEKHNYIITNIDMHTVDLEPYQYGGCTIIGVSLK